MFGSRFGAILIRPARSPRGRRRCVTRNVSNFMGQTSDSSAALANADIFFYPLQRDHYGTAENALVEAMSLGLTPVVLNNPPEMAIVRDSETGFVAKSIEEIGSLAGDAAFAARRAGKISRNAIRDVTETRSPVLVRTGLHDPVAWLAERAGPPLRLRRAIGGTPAEWYLSTQRIAGAAWTPARNGGGDTASKGRWPISKRRSLAMNLFLASESLAPENSSRPAAATVSG